MASAETRPIPVEVQPSPNWKRQEMVTRDGALPSATAGSLRNGSLRDVTFDATLEAADVTEAELADFLAADDEPVEANPVFKERLRKQLWAMIQEDDLPRH